MQDYRELLVNYLGQGGKMESNLPGFVFRQEQLNMAIKVAEAFSEEAFMTAEAGTGVGKTFAYLLPAILWATNQKEKVVISTRTKALQQQIVDRDLPDLVKSLTMKVRYAEAKGRDNFLCWNKYLNILAGKKSLETGQDEFIQALLRWAETTKTGDRKELPLSSELMNHWSLVSADRNSCQKELCHYRDKCFRHKMIRSLEKADVIIANHALLLSDVLVDNSLLPAYEYLIIDEAHSFIKESFDKLSIRFSYYEVLEKFKILYQKDRRNRKGYLFHLQANFPQLSPLINELKTMVEQMMKLTTEFFMCISQGIRYDDAFSFSHIVTTADRNKEWYNRAIDIYVNWQHIMSQMNTRLKKIGEELEGEEAGLEIGNLLISLQEISDAAYYLMEEDLEKEDRILWIEYDHGQAVALCSSAINSGEIVQEKLYSKLKSTIMVSATLTVDDSFENFISRSGLLNYQQDGRLLTLLEHSPFDYEQQACLFVVQDLPDPASQRFNQEVNETLEQILSLAGGKTMVLFTSRKQLQDASRYLRGPMEAQKIKLLTQYENGEFATLVDEFVSTDRAVLMGLETFWEGIDLKGDDLTCLVIVKIPFRSPSDPYCSAWEKYYRFQRQSSFEHFMLPDAAVRFKQGVGRLIRSEKDHGAVVVLDTRLVKKKYGQVLTRSIPIKNLRLIDKAQLNAELEQWL